MDFINIVFDYEDKSSITPICNSIDSMTAAFKLLTALCSGCVENLRTLYGLLHSLFYTGIYCICVTICVTMCVTKCMYMCVCAHAFAYTYILAFPNITKYNFIINGFPNVYNTKCCLGRILQKNADLKIPAEFKIAVGHWPFLTKIGYF